MRGRKDIWCAKSEVIFFNFECVLHEIEGPGQKLFIDFQRHFIHNFFKYYNKLHFIFLLLNPFKLTWTFMSFICI
jgi:hypothetical protein